MKNFLSVSVCSSQPDHTTVHTFLGQDCQISRKGTDGDYYKVANKCYYMRGVKRVAQLIKFSKVGDYTSHFGENLVTLLVGVR